MIGAELTVLGDPETQEIVPTFDGESFVLSREEAAEFLSAFYQCYRKIGGSVDVVH